MPSRKYVLFIKLPQEDRYHFYAGLADAVIVPWKPVHRSAGN